MTHRLFTMLLMTAVLAAPCLALAQETEKKAEGPGKVKAEAKEEAKGEGKEGEKKVEDESPRQLIWKIVNFVAFFGLAFYFLRKPAAEFFSNRTASIKREMEEAKAAREQAEKRLAEIEAQLARLGQDIAGLKAEAAREDATTAERIRKDTETDAAKILANAEAEISTLARTARLDLKVYTSELAVELAKQRIQKEMTPETQQRLLQHYVGDLSDGKGGSN
jgi:F-type H+-transporting ATPase subunit b